MTEDEQQERDERMSNAIRLKRADEMPARDLTPEHTKRRPAGGGPNHPDVQAAMRYVESVVDTSDFEGALAWHGWALREAFLAGCSHAAATEEMIREHGLMVRPSLVPGQWIAGRWQGTPLNALGGGYCVPGTEREADTLAEAVSLAVQALGELPYRQVRAVAREGPSETPPSEG